MRDFETWMSSCFFLFLKSANEVLDNKLYIFFGSPFPKKPNNNSGNPMCISSKMVRAFSMNSFVNWQILVNQKWNDPAGMKYVYREQTTYLYAECSHILMQRTNLIVQLCDASPFLTRIATLQVQAFQRTRFGTNINRRCHRPLPFNTFTHRRQRLSAANSKMHLFVSAGMRQTGVEC